MTEGIQVDWNSNPQTTVDLLKLIKSNSIYKEAFFPSHHSDLIVKWKAYRAVCIEFLRDHQWIKDAKRRGIVRRSLEGWVATAAWVEETPNPVQMRVSRLIENIRSGWSEAIEKTFTETLLTRGQSIGLINDRKDMFERSFPYHTLLQELYESSSLPTPSNEPATPSLSFTTPFKSLPTQNNKDTSSSLNPLASSPRAPAITYATKGKDTHRKPGFWKRGLEGNDEASMKSRKLNQHTAIKSPNNRVEEVSGDSNDEDHGSKLARHAADKVEVSGKGPAHSGHCEAEMEHEGPDPNLDGTNRELHTPNTSVLRIPKDINATYKPLWKFNNANFDDIVSRVMPDCQPIKYSNDSERYSVLRQVTFEHYKAFIRRKQSLVDHDSRKEVFKNWNFSLHGSKIMNHPTAMHNLKYIIDYLGGTVVDFALSDAMPKTPSLHCQLYYTPKHKKQGFMSKSGLVVKHIRLADFLALIDQEIQKLLGETVDQAAVKAKIIEWFDTV